MTLLLHAAFDGDDVLVWGEMPAGNAASPPKPRGRRPKKPAIPASPFDPGPGALSASLPELEDQPVSRAVLWLPTTEEQPAASDPLIAEPLDEDFVLAPWSTSVVVPTVPKLIEVLCRCMVERVLAPGVFAGRDLAYWASALRFAGALVAGGNVLPDLVEEEDGFHGRWRPVVRGDEVDLQARLAAAMPDACRAVGETAPMVAPAEVLERFVERMVDALIRSVHDAPRRAEVKGDTVDERWLAALRGPESRVQGSPEELVALRARCRDWRRPIAILHEGPVRLCFRLEAPPLEEDEEGETNLRPTEGDWTLRFLVQSARDPSLMVPASEAWEAKGARLRAFRAGPGAMRDTLLAALGRAARLCPLIEEALSGTFADAAVTDAAGAVAFLTDHALTLGQAGFGVMLPAWWTGRGNRPRLTARGSVKSAGMASGGGLALDEIIRFDWQVALGDRELSRRDLLALARMKAPLVRVRGQWVLLDAAEIEAAIDLLRRRETGLTGRDALRLALGGGEAGNGLAVTGGDVRGWLADVLAGLGDRDSIAPLDPPAGFAGRLRPYQWRGYSWLGFLRRWGLGACLADDMGLGKTVQALALILRDKEADAKGGAVLLVCPTSVIGNWQREAARFAPGLGVAVHHGGGRRRGKSLRKQASKHDVVLTSYALLQRDAEALGAVEWRGVILDEAQNVKNPDTKQAKAARALTAGYRVALTGTPVENSVGDLWSIMEFLNPGHLGTRAEFKRRFLVPIQAERDAAATEALKTLSGPFILRRLKTDKSIIADLPEKMEMKVYCSLTEEQASLYAAVLEEAMDALEGSDGIRRKGLVLALLSKLKQVCNHPCQFLGDNSAIPDRSGKLARLTEMLEEVLAEGERALVFTQFAVMGTIIKTHLENTFGREVPFLHGGVDKAKRDAMIGRFQEDGGPPVFLLSLKAGGTGLNLTAANHIFHFDRWGNPAVEDQATDRAFRIGQTRSVQVHKFICAGTMEDRIDEMIETKKALADAVVGAGEGWLTEFTTEELRDILTLRGAAVEGGA